MSMLNSEINDHRGSRFSKDPSQYALKRAICEQMPKENSRIDFITVNMNNKGNYDFAVNMGNFDVNVNLGYDGREQRIENMKTYFRAVAEGRTYLGEDLEGRVEAIVRRTIELEYQRRATDQPQNLNDNT